MKGVKALTHAWSPNRTPSDCINQSIVQIVRDLEQSPVAGNRSQSAQASGFEGFVSWGTGLSHQECMHSSALVSRSFFRQTYFSLSLHAPHLRQKSCCDLPRQESLRRHSFIILWRLSGEIRVAAAGPRLLHM